jgi:hypothetical protein
MINSTVCGNRTTDNSDGDSGGGGIFVNNNSLDLTSSTIANNTCAGNGGGIYLYKGYTTVRSSLIAGNSALAGPDCSGQLPGTLNWGAFTSTGYNLVGKTNRCTGFSGASHDLLGSIAAPLDPKLGPLQDNGGPTPTMALLTGSPAIDQGSSPLLTTDQCGHQRPFEFASIPNPPGGDGSDIGAFEVNPPVLIGGQSAGNLGFSWYGGGAFYTLEAATSLNANAVWANAPVTPTIVGGRYFVTIPLDQGNRFYRLKSP